jgi:hypothetical protein
MDVYMLTNTKDTFGHAALITGSGKSYDYQSYGSGSGHPSSGVASVHFTSIGAASAYASKWYDAINQWHTTPAQDSAASAAMAKQNPTTYWLCGPGSNNCQDSVNKSLTAAGLTHYNSDDPNIAAWRDSSVSDLHYGLANSSGPDKSGGGSSSGSSGCGSSSGSS